MKNQKTYYTNKKNLRASLRPTKPLKKTTGIRFLKIDSYHCKIYHEIKNISKIKLWLFLR